MKRVIQVIKENKKYIFMFFILLVVLGTINSCIFAAINQDSKELSVNRDSSWFGDLAEAIVNTIVTTIGNVAIGTVMKILNVFVLSAAAFCFILLWFIWELLGGSMFDLPLPDNIVFNKMVMFDPNFINPTATTALIDSAKETNLMAYVQEVVSSLYFTFFIIAGLIMVIAAMVIGIKMALTSIAIEKAQYKETLNKWLLGIVLLFCLHFLILGIFTINEQVCEIASNIADECTFKFDFSEYNVVTKAVGILKGLFSGAVSFLTGNGWEYDDSITVNLKGYFGIIVYLMLTAVLNGDIIASLALLALLGQSINLICRYLKRFVLIIFMGIIAPLVVAVDVIKRAI